MPPFIPPSDSATVFNTPLYSVIVSDDRAIVGLASLLIERAGVSQGEIARTMGVTRQSINNLIRGRIKRPSMWYMAKLAHACGASLKLEWHVNK